MSYYQDFTVYILEVIQLFIHCNLLFCWNVIGDIYGEYLSCDLHKKTNTIRRMMSRDIFLLAA